MTSPPLLGTLTCPRCGATEQQEIPQDRCMHAYVCSACHETITTTDDACCVFCAYGDRTCPVAMAANSP